MDNRAFKSLEVFLQKIPGISPPLSHGYSSDGQWWVKFTIDIDNPYSWQVVQELGHILNYLSLNERLPTVFKPVSPPPYLNGGPRDFLSWVIECSDKDFKPGAIAKWLEGRMPQPVDDTTQWELDE
ncbi:hypothetical protein QO259_13425 [Salinicola sp. JS01]|uniref:hypothetical protein n=1 Tax=Salinicola sp. JS01 TaxID=3050071 RepID=UPI00255BA871|nr:hypothetical protein [Salinicola sp. JS01]WIX31806.1 hypothetical protein QO259_13425 [Salinicola sp. JS01]